MAHVPSLVSTVSPKGVVMDEAYLFKDGVQEFTRPPGTKLIRQFRIQVRKFLSSPARAVSEFPLQMFSTWYQDLPLSKMLTHDADEIWQYKVVILYPTHVNTKKVDVTRLKWAKDAATQFYSTSFNSTKADLTCIDMAVNSDPSIMVVGRPIGEGEDQFRTVIGCADAVVISCITFRNGIQDEVGSSLVLWLLIAESESRKPSCITSWRRQGFGRLMLIMLIKQSTFALLTHQGLSCCQLNLPGVDVYLQCPHKEPMTFYHACGFHQINLQGTTGMELLPKTIANSLVEESGNGCAWIVPESDEHCIIPLMQLCSGTLLNSPSVVELEQSPEEEIEEVSATNAGRGRNEFVWCRYPPSTFDKSNAFEGSFLSKADLEVAFSGLNLLNDLIRPPFGVVVHPDKMRATGEVGSHARLAHSKSEGKTWMATGELQMMTALLMMDGRYEASVAIISFTDMQLIQGCFELLQNHLSAKKYEADLIDAKEAELRELSAHIFNDIENEYERDVARVKFVGTEIEKYTENFSALVKEKYGGSKEDLFLRYDDQMNHVVKNILFFYPGLLQKRLIVFPTNLQKNHWGATFVFNAGNIVHGSDDVSPGWCRTCFFRYCSLHPYGTTKIPNQVGIIWFLNLAFSYEEEQKRSASVETSKKMSTPNQMKWHSPFGRTFFGEMKGTEKFPALRVLEIDVLPRQHDGHSCGIGLIASIAIILREIIGTNNGGTRFNEIFSHDHMKVRVSTDMKVEEHICCFPPKTFPRVMNPGLSGYTSYLHLLKAEWFVLFDRIAELQHVTMPRRQLADHLVDPHYVTLKRELQKLHWPPNVPLYVEKENVTLENDLGDSKPSASEEAPEKENVTLENDLGDSKPSASEEAPVVAGDKDHAKQEEVDDHKPAGNDPLKLPPAGKVWKGGPALTYGYGPIHTPDECPKGHVAKSRYRTFVSGDDVDNFRKKWRRRGDDKKDRPVLPRDEEAMNKFIESRFLYWGWSSTKDREKEVEMKREEMRRKIDRCKKKTTKDEYREQYTKEITFMKKERKKYRRAFELEWTFGAAAMVHGLKYNPGEDSFAARLVYSVKTTAGSLEQKEEHIIVSKNWIKDADYAEGVIQHVINLGNTDEFVPVPPGESILIHTKKVHKLRYVHPHTQWVPDPDYKRLRSNNDSPGKRMKQIPAPGYWEVVFHGETQPMRTDDEFVSQFKEGFLDEVKRLRCGFVDIPTGDFKESHLHQHPNLLLPEAPCVHFVQSDGEDLCVSKSLASALHAIGFVAAAESINQYGESHLRGGTVDAIRKVGEYAESQLPKWITRKVRKRPHMFDWQLLQDSCMKDTIVLGVLNESDGNGSHAVTIHGGYVYDANEVVAIPLCKAALDYCCSTSTVKNEFVSFRKATLFFYDGQNMNRKSLMTLRVPLKRKRDNGSDGELQKKLLR